MTVLPSESFVYGVRSTEYSVEYQAMHLYIRTDTCTKGLLINVHSVIATCETTE